MNTINARNKGNSFERWFCRWLFSKGFEAVTSRSESKRLDDLGVDIVTPLPFNFQLKAVERLGSTHKILWGMPTDKTPVVVHKRNNQGVIISMKLEDFEKWILEKQ